MSLINLFRSLMSHEMSATLKKRSITLSLNIVVASHGCYGVSNHLQLICCFKNLFSISERNIEVPHQWPFMGGPTGDDGFSPQKPVIRKASSSHDVIIGSVIPVTWCAQVRLTWYMGDFRAGVPLSKQFNTKMTTMWRALHNKLKAFSQLIVNVYHQWMWWALHIKLKAPLQLIMNAYHQCGF